MEKKELRKAYKLLRKDCDVDLLEKWSKEIFEMAIDSFDFEGKKVSVFLPIERFSEINTMHFLNKLNATFYLPVIKENNQLIHVKYESMDQIRISDWGIPEPTYGEEIFPAELDIVLVPLLVVDKKGFRVGYGKGFYDRFLASCNPNCLFIGLSYFEEIDAISEVNEHDIALHACIMPTKVITFE